LNIEINLLYLIMENIFNGLIEFDSTEEFNEFVDNIDKSNALMIIEKQIEYSQQGGVFTLLESATLLKCLNKLKENEKI
jgi:hypothetical protein